MPQRVVALIGSGKGPKIFVGGAAGFELLNVEADAGVTIFWPDGKESFFPLKGGNTVPVDDCHYVQFSYEGKNNSFIALVHLEV